MTKAISLLSGGLDSIVATGLAMHTYDVTCALTFDYSQRANLREAETAARFCDKFSIEHRIVKLPWLASWTKTALVDKMANLPTVLPEGLESEAENRARQVWVPNRNGAFIAIAASLAEFLGAGTIIAGFNAEEAATFPDNSAEFVNATNAALALSTLNKVRLESPTLHMTKTEIAKGLLSLRLEPDSFWCCYEGGEKLCGVCESCARTIRAFKEMRGWEAIEHRF
ncbi:MAG: 7-cyano-7-deazaguanine synthase QueC [Pseudomonadota bacterium]